MACIVYKALLHLCINKYLQGSDKEKSAVSASQQKYQRQLESLLHYSRNLQYAQGADLPLPNQSINHSICDMDVRVQPMHDKNMHLIVHCTWEGEGELACSIAAAISKASKKELTAFDSRRDSSVVDIKTDKQNGTDVEMTRTQSDTVDQFKRNNYKPQGILFFWTVWLQ